MLTSIADIILCPHESMVSFHSGNPSGMTGSELSSYKWSYISIRSLTTSMIMHFTSLTLKRVFDGRGPTLHMYRHLGSGPVGVDGRHSIGIALSLSCICSSTKLRGTSTPSGVTPTWVTQNFKCDCIKYFLHGTQTSGPGSKFRQTKRNFKIYDS